MRARNMPDENEIIRIPVIDFVLVLVLAGLIGLGFRITHFFTARKVTQIATQAGLGD